MLREMKKTLAVLGTVGLLAVVVVSGCSRALPKKQSAPDSLRVATFNIEELSTEKIHNLDATGSGVDEQARAAAEVIKRVRPDILVLNEIDIDWNTVSTGGDIAANLRLFNKHYLNTGENAIHYPYAFCAPSNTGLLSGFDFNNDKAIATDADRGERAHGDDSFGYGIYPGQYAMGILSKYPFDTTMVRTFQTFLWKDLPGKHLPIEWYDKEEQNVFRLSSKSHWDVPFVVNGNTIHLLVSHPTPPVFDGPEDRNGRRNHDEIKFWKHYLNNEPAIYDDLGIQGGLAPDARFVIAGDLNASPDAEPVYDGINAIGQLLSHPRVQDTATFTVSEGAPAGKPAATAEFLNGTRVDYVLPSTNQTLQGGGVYWPSPESNPAGAKLADTASDHRMVWIDLKL